MGSFTGKIVSRQDVCEIKTFRLEEKVERLESEVMKMRSEIETYHKSNSASACPSTTARSNESEGYSICEPHSELIKRRGSVVIFTEALLKAELQRLRGENNVLSKELAVIRQPTYLGFQLDHLDENDDQN